jgi:hypothetical protein
LLRIRFFVVILTYLDVGELGSLGVRAASELFVAVSFLDCMLFSLLGGILMMMLLGGGAARLRWSLTVFVNLSEQ